MRLTEDIYLVGGGDYSFNISHRLDCHVYVIRGRMNLHWWMPGLTVPRKS